MCSSMELMKGLTGDCICLRNLHLTAIVGLDAWERQKPQQVILSLRLQADLKNAGTSDNIVETTSYGKICKDILGFVAAHDRFTNLEDMSLWICMLAHQKKWGGSCIYLNINLPKGSLRAENGLSFETVCMLSRDLNECRISSNARKFYINDLRLACIIGVNAHERLTKQFVMVSLVIIDNRTVPGIQPYGWDHQSHWQNLIRAVIEVSTVYQLYLGSWLIVFRLWKHPHMKRSKLLQRKLQLYAAAVERWERSQCLWKSRVH